MKITTHELKELIHEVLNEMSFKPAGYNPKSVAQDAASMMSNAAADAEISRIDQEKGLPSHIPKIPNKIEEPSGIDYEKRTNILMLRYKKKVKEIEKIDTALKIFNKRVAVAKDQPKRILFYSSQISELLEKKEKAMNEFEQINEVLMDSIREFIKQTPQLSANPSM